MEKKFNLMVGDNMISLKTLGDNSIDAVVTDSPYGLSFMNKKWDYDVPSVEFWKEVYRVLKPGGHILSFGGTRTYHRMVVNMEDAGFEIRDQIMWIYGSGFPKSHNIGKAIDKLQGKSDFEGWGTALKPAVEPICLARKPLSENTVAQNVLEWETGGINIDGCRVGSEGGTKAINFGENKGEMFGGGKGKPTNDIEELNEGRFPANIIFECICDEVIKGKPGSFKKTYRTKAGTIYGGGKGCNVEETGGYTGDKGDIHTNPDCPCYMLDEQSGASRFFYQSKVSKKERNMGLEEFTNLHPTIKPVQLMSYLVRMITPVNGVVCDPFMGAGSTGIASQLEGFNFIGMEMDEEYFKIASKRIENYKQYQQFVKK